MEGWDTQSSSTCRSSFWNKLRLKIAHEECFSSFFFPLFSFSVILRNTAVLLHSGYFLNVRITAVFGGAWDCSDQCNITDFLNTFFWALYLIFCNSVFSTELEFTALQFSLFLHLTIWQGRDVTVSTSIMGVSLHIKLAWVHKNTWDGF